MVPELAEGNKKIKSPHTPPSSLAKRAACGRGLRCIPFDRLRDRSIFNGSLRKASIHISL